MSLPEAAPRGRIRAQTRIPVAVSLQGEHTWIDGLPQEPAEKAWSLLRRGAADADLFMPVSVFYAGTLAAKPGIPRERMGFGVLAEAFALLKRMPGMGSVILTAMGGSAAPREIADAPYALLRDPAYAGGFAARGRSGVKARYSARVMAEAALEAFGHAARERKTA